MESAASEIEEIQVGLLRALASSHRLRILHVLADGPQEVGEVGFALGVSPAAASQHLAALRGVGLVESSRDGRYVRYRLADPQVLAACDLMREVIVRRLSRLGSLVGAAIPREAAASETHSSFEVHR